MPHAVRRLSFVLPLLLLPMLGGCSIFAAQPYYRGNAVAAYKLKQLTPGVSTRSDVRALLGSPTLHEAFDDSNWVYVSQITKERIAQRPGVAQQHVVVLHFNKQGILQSVKHVSGKQAVTVAMAGGETKAPGGSASFLQQLIGGVGQYNPGLGAGGSNGLGLGSGATGF